MENEINKILESLQNAKSEEDLPQEFAIFGALLSLEDKQFEIVSPLLMTEIEKQYSDPAFIYGLIAEMRKNGENVSDFITLREDLVKAINDIEEISQIKKDFVIRIFDLLTNQIQEAIVVSPSTITIPIELLSEDIKVPTYANIGDAGMDIYSPADYTINPGETVLIKCGFKVAIPAGYELQVRPKSGLSLKSKLRVANAPGTIDSGYRDEVGVIIENIDAPYKDSDLYGSPYYIEKGQKFAQLVLQKVPVANFQVVESIDAIAGDRGGGFGSSGKF